MLKITPAKIDKVVYEDIDLTLAPEPKQDLVGTTYSGLGMTKIWAHVPFEGELELCEDIRDYRQYELEQKLKSGIKLADLKRK